MTDPVVLSSRSARFGLPFLFQGQAQKEFFVNEAHALLDALLHPVVEAIQAVPPPAPQEGQCWIVDANPSGPWAGHFDDLACYQVGSWLFARPAPGMRVFDRGSGSELRFDGAWRTPASVAPPSGGTTVDIEARAAIAALIQALENSGLLSANG